jgi:hypothetical protein
MQKTGDAVKEKPFSAKKEEVNPWDEKLSRNDDKGYRQASGSSTDPTLRLACSIHASA